MQLITILGSPRPHGNTNAVLQLFEQQAVAAGHTVQRFNVVDLWVNGCAGCDACQVELEEPGCIEADDFLNLLAAIRRAELVIYAAPVYVWSFPAQMKAVIDRHYCTVKWLDGEKAAMLLAGKRMALLVTCGGTAAENADLICREFERQMAYLGCRVAGEFVVDECTTPTETARSARAQQTAAQMAGLLR